MNLYPPLKWLGLFNVYFEFSEILFPDYLAMANLCISNQIRGYKSCTTDIYKHWRVMRTHILEFCEIPFICYLVMTQFVDFSTIQGQKLIVY